MECPTTMMLALARMPEATPNEIRRGHVLMIAFAVLLLEGIIVLFDLETGLPSRRQQCFCLPG
jgi:hypothetical protein